MMAVKELLFTTEKTGQQQNILMADLHTGTTMKTFKDDSSIRNSLCLMKGEYILTAITNKPLVYSWAIESKDKSRMKLVLPGLATALANTTDGNFLVAAVAEKLYIWQTTSGDLLAVLSQHHQNVRTLKFTDDNSYMISAGDDNLIIVWEFQKIVQRNRSVNSVIEPLYILSGHSLPVTDLHCGSGGPSARLVSVSLDHTCKVWDLLSGKCLATLVFKHPVTSVVMDSSEMHLFIGSQNGEIHKVNVHKKPLDEVSAATNEAILFGHDQSVQCLTVSLDGTLLVSGAEDGKVMVWDISSGQCVRTIPHKGSITNLMVAMSPRSLQKSGSYPTPIMPLKKTVTQDSDDVIHIAGTPADDEIMDEELSSEELKKYFSNEDKSDSSQLEAMQNLKEEMVKWKDLCQVMYQKAVKDIVEEK